MTDVEQIRTELSGDRFSQEPQASFVFALAVHSFTRWPVDAWAGMRDDQGRLRTLYWIQGNTLGKIVAEGDENSLTISGVMQLISNISAVHITAEVSLDDFVVGRGRRAVTVKSMAQKTSLWTSHNATVICANARTRSSMNCSTR